MANTSDNFAYIWPSSKYFAINLNKNTYININGEPLSKCIDFFTFLSKAIELNSENWYQELVSKSIEF